MPKGGKDKQRYMGKALYTLAGALLIASITLLATGCEDEQLFIYEDTRNMMGTFVTISLYASNQEKAAEVFDAAFMKMEEIESEASIFDEKSEAFQLNRDGSLEDPSEDLRQMINLSLDYGRITDGCFDITIQPLLELWEGGLWQESAAVQQSTIAETMELVGYDKVVIDENRIYFSVEDMEITLGGIAKGYAADAGLEVIQGMGIEHAIINAGGDMAMLGTKPGGDLWKVALVNPDNTSQSLAEFALSDQAIATSGNYERYFDPEKTSHHIIDPHTGYSATDCISATVIASSVTKADALATSIFVMGPDEGIGLIESLDNTECLIVDSERDTHSSSGLSEYLITGLISKR